MKIEAENFMEMLVTRYQATCHIPKDSNIHSYVKILYTGD